MIRSLGRHDGLAAKPYLLTLGGYPALPSITHTEVDLSDVQLPRHAAGMVLSQPYLELTPNEPFRCTVQSRSRHLRSIKAALIVALARSHGAEKTHFTVFPEYSIPFPNGVNLIEEFLQREDWPGQTIVIGGIDGISATDFTTLAGRSNSNIQEDLRSVPAAQWINCAAIWAKRDDGRVERWLQPKLFASWPEQNVNNDAMFQGSSVFVFKGPLSGGTQYRFAVLVCFDWIAPGDGERPWRAIVESISEEATAQQTELPLSWLFVIQNNPKPSHTSFMEEVNRFFDQTIVENVRRDRACVVFANSAGRPTPGKTDAYGATSLIFSRQALFETPTCYSTFCTGGARFRGHSIISYHKDILFRERGACIHSFEQVNPGSVVAGPAGRTIALRNPYVYPDGSPSDQRTPAGLVSASVKWLNDELDAIDSLAVQYSDAALSGDVEGVHERIKSGLRRLAGAGVERAVALASAGVVGCGAPPRVLPTADDWQEEQSDAVVHMVHTFSILGICTRCWTLAESSGHATISSGEWKIDVYAIRGETHEECREHFARRLPAGRHRVLVVSRDVDNIEWLERFGNYVDQARGDDSCDRDFTDPRGITWQLGYKDLLDIFRHSDTVDQARGRLYDALRR